MKTKDYKVLARAVEEGAAYGVRRYFKHRDVPEGGIEGLADTVAEAVITEVCEWFDLEEPRDG